MRHNGLSKIGELFCGCQGRDVRISAALTVVGNRRILGARIQAAPDCRGMVGASCVRYQVNTPLNTGLIAASCEHCIADNEHHYRLGSFET